MPVLRRDFLGRMNLKANPLVKPEGDLDLVVNAEADEKGSLRKVQGYEQVGDTLSAIASIKVDTEAEWDEGVHTNTMTDGNSLILTGGSIEQTEQNDHHKLYGDNWFAQSFVATSTSVSKVSLLLDKITNPSVAVLVVGGGGAGGVSNNPEDKAGGGGGAGGYVYNASYVVSPGSYAVTVGAANGGNSIFGTITAYGGGQGGDYAGAAGNGGSGGGGAELSSQAGGSGTAGQGYNGASGDATAGNAGGGGGASAAGSGVTGGAGTSNSISGSAVTYCRGGNGGSAGTGTGTKSTTYGSGGGGRDRDAVQGTRDAGIQGVVIIRYLTAAMGTCTGGTITTDGSYTVHTFTSSGTFTVGGGALTDLDVRIETDSSNKPSGTEVTNGTATIDDASVTASPTWHDATFATAPTLTVGTKYWIVGKQTGGSASDYYRWYKQNSNVYTNGDGFASTNGGTTWGADPDGATDAAFKIYSTYLNSGNWVSGNQTLNAGQTLAQITIDASDLSAQSYIDQVDILNTSNAVQASYTTNIASGTTKTLRSSDITMTYTNGNTFRIKLTLASNGVISPRINKLQLDTPEAEIKLLTPLYQSTGTRTLIAGVAGTIKRLASNQWVDVDTSLTSGLEMGAAISRASKNTIVKTATATAGAATSLTDGNYLTHPNSMQGKFIKIVRGTGAGQVRVIQSNTGTTTSTTTSTTTTMSTSTTTSSSTTRSTSTSTTA